MHNPDTFGFLQFAGPAEADLCGNVEWPARYVLAQVYQAEIAFVQSQGSYTESLEKLLKGGYCTLDNGCSASSLRKVATVYEHIFQLKIVVENAATSCVRQVWGWKMEDYFPQYLRGSKKFFV